MNLDGEDEDGYNENVGEGMSEQQESESDGN
jgi:hypothetical protein